MSVAETAYSFTIRAWSAWSPELSSTEDWQQWAQAPCPLSDDGAASVSEMPAMLRRRAGRLGRAALQVLYAQAPDYRGQPVVYCSRYGEMQRTLDLLDTLADEGGVSPQQFSMAVHNATAGLFMMAQQYRAPITALASEDALALSGLTEAHIQLADGADEVWLLYCDEPLPDRFKPFNGNQPGCHAVLLVLQTGSQFTVQTVPDTSGQLATALDLLQYMLDDRIHQLLLAPGWQLRKNSHDA